MRSATLTTRHNRPVQQSGPGPARATTHPQPDACTAGLLAQPRGGKPLAHPTSDTEREGEAGEAPRAPQGERVVLVPVIIIVRLPRSALDKVASRARHLDRLRAVRAAGIGVAALEAAWGGRRLGGRRVRVSAAGPP